MYLILGRTFNSIKGASKTKHLVFNWLATEIEVVSKIYGMSRQTRFCVKYTGDSLFRIPKRVLHGRIEPVVESFHTTQLCAHFVTGNKSDTVLYWNRQVALYPAEIEPASNSI